MPEDFIVFIPVRGHKYCLDFQKNTFFSPLLKEIASFMELPAGVTIYGLKQQLVWLDKGIRFSKARAGVPAAQDNLEIREEIEKPREPAGRKKEHIVVEPNPATVPPKKEQRDLIDPEMHRMVKAMAIVTSSPVSRMIANLFFSFRPVKDPVNMFNNQKDAVARISQFIDKL
jgi:hypothetical protein